MSKLFFVFLFTQLITACGVKDQFTGKWINLDDSLSFKDSKPVYFEKKWYLYKYNNFLCAVRIVQIQNFEWKAPDYYFGNVYEDSVRLTDVIDDGEGNLFLSRYRDSVTLKLIDNRLLNLERPDCIYECLGNWYDFVDNPFKELKVENGKIKSSCEGTNDCDKQNKCVRIINHFSPRKAQ